MYLATTKGNSTALWAAMLLVATIGLTAFSFYKGFSPEIVFVGLAASTVFVAAFLRAPQAFLVALVFIPQWKSFWPFSAADRVADLTLVMLACLLLLLVVYVLGQISRLDDPGVSGLFYGQSGVLVAYLLFAALVAASYFYTTAPDYGASKLFRFLAIGSLLLIAPLFLIRTEQELRRFFALFVIFAGLTVIQLLTRLQAPAVEGDVTRIGAGWLIGMAAIIVLFYPLFPSESSQRVFLICSFPILVLGMIASVARGPMVALLVVVLIRVALWFKEGHRTAAISLVAVFALSGLGAFVLLRHAGGNKYTNKAKELVDMVEGDATRGSATTRLSFYQKTLPEIPNHPLLGHGVGSWSKFYYGRDEREYPHNLFVEIAFEEGLLGLAALMLILFRSFSSSLWLWRKSGSAYLVPAVLVLYCLIICMFSGDLDDNRLLWLWIGLTMALCRNIRWQGIHTACRVRPAVPMVTARSF